MRSKAAAWRDAFTVLAELMAAGCGKGGLFFVGA